MAERKKERRGKGVEIKKKNIKEAIQKERARAEKEAESGGTVPSQEKQREAELPTDETY